MIARCFSFVLCLVHPASFVLRTQLEEAMKGHDGAKSSMERSQSAEQRFSSRQKAVEAATTKHDQLTQ